MKAVATQQAVVMAMVYKKLLVSASRQSRRAVFLKSSQKIETPKELTMATTSHQAVIRHQNQRSR